jgi:hypothetical protein
VCPSCARTRVFLSNFLLLSGRCSGEVGVGAGRGCRTSSKRRRRKSGKSSRHHLCGAVFCLFFCSIVAVYFLLLVRRFRFPSCDIRGCCLHSPTPTTDSLTPPPFSVVSFPLLWFLFLCCGFIGLFFFLLLLPLFSCFFLFLLFRTPLYVMGNQASTLDSIRLTAEQVEQIREATSKRGKALLSQWSV